MSGRAGAGVQPTVAFVLPSFAGGGAERVVLTLLEALDRERVAPVLVVLDRNGPLTDAVPDGVPCVDLGRARLRGAIPGLFRALRGLRAEVVLSTLPHVSLVLLAGRRWLPAGTRLVLREPNAPSASIANQPVPWLFRLAYRRLYHRADAILCNAARTADELAATYRVPRARLVALANPVPVARYRAMAAPPLRAPGAGARFVAAGRLTPQKGFDRLIDMIGALGGDGHVTILGDGPGRGALEARVQRLGITQRVRFAGFVAKPWPHYAGADAFLLPSRWEGMSNAALEALACGTPVIATPEAGGIVELAEAPGVTIAVAGRPFTDALGRVQPTPCASIPETGPRPSLLPTGFEPEAVARSLADTLTAVARA